MFFFIAGIQPRTVTVDKTPRRCSQCGLSQMVTRRVDHYFSFFFIPLVRVRKGKPFMYCQKCDRPVEEGTLKTRSTVCGHCGRSVEPRFTYCPYCGQRQ